MKPATGEADEEVVHGVPGARRVVAGGGTRTAHRLARCARAAFDAALGLARAGNRVDEIGRAVQGVVRQEGFATVKGLCGHGSLVR